MLFLNGVQHLNIRHSSRITPFMAYVSALSAAYLSVFAEYISEKIGRKNNKTGAHIAVPVIAQKYNLFFNRQTAGLAFYLAYPCVV